MLKSCARLILPLLWAATVQAAPAPRAFLNAHEAALPSGGRVVWIHHSKQPMVDVRVLFHGGSAYDGKHPGVAYACNALLNQGSHQHDAQSTARRFASVGALYGNGIGRLSASLQLRTLTQTAARTQAFAALHDVLTQPAFPPQAVARVRTQMAAALKAQSVQPGPLAAKAFYRVLYAKTPYAHPVLGSLNSVKAWTRADVRQFYQQHYVRHQALVVMVGDVNRHQAVAWASQLLKGLPQGAPQPPALIMAHALPSARTVRIVRPTSQSLFLLGQLGVTRRAPRYPALLLASRLLGGGQQSLLFDVLRNQHGLVYGVSSSLMPAPYRGPFVIRWQTRSAQAEASLHWVQSTLAQWVKAGPSDQDVARAQHKWLGSRALNLASNASQCDAVASLAFAGLPLNTYDHLRMQIAALSGQQVRDAVHTFFKPESMLLVRVGPATSRATLTQQQEQTHAPARTPARPPK